MAAVEIRSPTGEELRATLAALEAAFGAGLDDAFLESARATMPLDRVLAAFEGGRPVAVAASWPFRLSIPGGELPTAGVTWVGVLPSHRRRGLLRELMRRQLDDVRARGEPLAALWASEAVIYGRFGYGIAAPVHRLAAEVAGFALRDDPGPSGRMRLVDAAEALELFPPVYERARAATPGMPSRDAAWWRELRLVDRRPPGGAGPRFYAVLEADGTVEGYVAYRVKEDWQEELAHNSVHVVEAVAVSPAAARELWRFLFSIDLAVRVEAFPVDPAAPLFHAVRDPRRLGLRLHDGMWLRLVDVEAALAARSWAAGEPVVVELRDGFCPWNEGRWRLGPGAGRADAEAELALDAADLASLYLGGVPAEGLAAAGRLEERSPGAVGRLAALLRTPRPPFCPQIF